MTPEQMQTAIDEGFTTLVAATLLTGIPGSAGPFASEYELERAAQTAVQLRAKVREAAGADH